TQNDYLQDFRVHRKDILDALLGTYALPTNAKCQDCSEALGRWRCKDCHLRPLLCRGCCRHRHSRSLFHRLEKWTGSFFQQAALWEVGVYLSIPHIEVECDSCTAMDPASLQTIMSDTEVTLAEDPGDEADWEDIDEPTGELPFQQYTRRNPTSNQHGQPFVVIVDASGIHNLPLVMCPCRGADQAVPEAAFAGFLPSSFQEIRTLFTTRCLDEFRFANLECKTSAYQFYQLLRRRTNPANLMAIPDRYAELRRASREWRHLKKMKQNGFGHTKKAPGLGDLGLFCPACPQPGVNIPDDWQDPSNRDLYIRSFVTDGNFTADHLKQKRPEDDVWLLDGEGMMTGRQRYKEHLKVAIERNTKAPCERNFQAVEQANRSSTTKDVTGIVAVACARHGCFAPGSVSDMDKGEKQMIVDWGFCEAVRLTRVPVNGKILLYYDIYCQWSVHWPDRLAANSFLTLPPGIDVDGGIGLFHVHGHREQCLHRYATYFIPGAAVVDGEVLERLWSVLNLVSRSTRTATLAQRAEILDDHMNDNNWKKLIGIVAVICKRYQTAVVSAEETKKYFDGISESLHPSYIGEWTRQVEEAEALRADDPAKMDIMGTAGVKPKTRAEVEIDLVTGPAANQTAEIRLLMTGITLEEDQLNLQHYIHSKGRYYKSRADKVDIAGRRDRLRTRIDRFQTEILKLLDDDALAHLIGDASIIPFYPDQDAGQPAEDLPALELFLDEPGTHPEKMKIALPSVFPAQYMARVGMDTLRDQELQLRRGQANDALHSIRLAIGQKSFQYTSNMRHVDPNAPVTRPRAAIHALGRQISALRRVYAKCREAMVKLNIPQQELLSFYRVIEDSDVKTDTSIQEPNHPGSARDKLSWIFTSVQAETSPDNALSEYYRVHWLRARAHSH
ncbi:hypothetical protein M413DRAFT_47570, partial [Hebeloma cylindrosporum]